MSGTCLDACPEQPGEELLSPNHPQGTPQRRPYQSPHHKIGFTARNIRDPTRWFSYFGVSRGISAQLPILGKQRNIGISTIIVTSHATRADRTTIIHATSAAAQKRRKKERKSLVPSTSSGHTIAPFTWSQLNVTYPPQELHFTSLPSSQWVNNKQS